MPENLNKFIVLSGHKFKKISFSPADHDGYGKNKINALTVSKCPLVLQAQQLVRAMGQEEMLWPVYICV